MTTDEMDKEANVFAMCLLMPEKLVREEIVKLGIIDLCDDEPMKQLAKKFGVSISLMALRIGHLYPHLQKL